jgi:hypothetical protein
MFLLWRRLSQQAVFCPQTFTDSPVYNHVICVQLYYNGNVTGKVIVAVGHDPFKYDTALAFALSDWEK